MKIDVTRVTSPAAILSGPVGSQCNVNLPFGCSEDLSRETSPAEQLQDHRKHKTYEHND